MIPTRPGAGVRRAHISAVDQLEYFLRSRASKVVVLALVANTMVAQLLHNSAGQLVLGNQVLLGYLLISAICSTVAFALFEVSTIFHLHDLMALDVSIKAEIGAEQLIKRGYFVLAVSSLINFLSVLYFLALERWKLQKDAQIEQMMRDGVLLGAVAAALASPETAERIAVLEAATSGGLSALDAAQLNVRRAGHDLVLLDGLQGLQASQNATSPQTSRGEADGEENAISAAPLSESEALPMAWKVVTNGANGTHGQS